MTSNRRSKTRRNLEPLEISGFMSLDHMTLISRSAQIIDASASGLLIQVDHKELVPRILRETLTLEILVGDRVIFKISKLDLELSGRIIRTRLSGRKSYEIAVDFSQEAPEYWREALYELLPRPDDELDWEKLT